MFIADLHLQAEQAGTVHLAQRFLQELAPRSPLLFILGDFVEYWVGDDAGAPAIKPALDDLRALVHGGTDVMMMHGNRDFLLGESFARNTGVTLLRDDEYVLEIADQRLLLMHGDTLCTDDADYQAMRAQLRSPAWQQAFLTKSVQERRDYAMQLRAHSQSMSARKESAIMDVNEQAVLKAVERHECETLLHGHTHRPSCHTHALNSQTVTRVVVGDWHADHAMVAVMQGGQLRLQRFPEILAQLSPAQPAHLR